MHVHLFREATLQNEPYCAEVLHGFSDLRITLFYRVYLVGPRSEQANYLQSANYMCADLSIHVACIFSFAHVFGRQEHCIYSVMI